MRFEVHRVVVNLPTGWEAASLAGRPSHAPVMHMGNFALPKVRGDFGSGAVNVMGATDAFVSLLEYGPECVDTPLFAARGLPRQLRVADFASNALQITLPGQAGFQHFFTEAGRAFCLYVVIGGRANAGPTSGEINRTLAAISVGAR